MRGIVFLNHLDAGAAILGNLVDVGTFHQTQADVGVPEAISRAALSLAVELKGFFLKNVVEQHMLVVGENAIGRLGPCCASVT